MEQDEVAPTIDLLRPAGQLMPQAGSRNLFRSGSGIGTSGASDRDTGGATLDALGHAPEKIGKFK
jgi:hypothetical protein